MLSDQVSVRTQSDVHLNSILAKELDKRQVGAIRHIRNLVNQLPNDYSFMMPNDPFGESVEHFRFQFAFMHLALALTYRHRLPAARGALKPIMDRLVERMLEPAVWTPWYHASRGGGYANREVRGEGKWDPVGVDNIMYSAYLQLMVLLNHYLFDDDRYTKPGALTFKISPQHFEIEGKEFLYDENSLNNTIYWQMVENGYFGVACEPNCIFQACNQPNIIAFRIHDLLNKGQTADEINAGYVKAWEEFSLKPDGSYNQIYQPSTQSIFPLDSLVQADHQTGMLMHAWRPDFAEANYRVTGPRAVEPGPDGTLIVRSPTFNLGGVEVILGAMALGWTACAASEMGDLSTRDGLLDFADRYLQSRWAGGGYFFPRRDDQDPNLTYPVVMDVQTGNATLALARLNVPNGLRILYDVPLDADFHLKPALDAISKDLDVYFARFDPATATLSLVVSSWNDVQQKVMLSFSNVWRRSDWRLLVDQREVAAGDSAEVISCNGSFLVRRDEDLLVVEGDMAAKCTIEVVWGGK